MLFPESTEDVVRMIREARERGAGLVPLSSGSPHFHGGSENDGAETMCFSRMDRILAVDRRGRYCRAEAGVTFGELIPRVKEQGMRLNLPFLPRAGKSVVASVLEREAVLIPKYQYDYPDPLLTVEAVFGTGDVFRTGSASGPGSMEENRSDKVMPWGPGSVDYLRLFTAAQGTFGFVTWATLKTEVLPSLSTLFLIRSEELKPLTDLANHLLRERIPDECIILNGKNFAYAFGDTPEEESALAEAGPWILLCRVCGFDRYPEERLAIYEGYVKDACTRFGLAAEKDPDFLPVPAAKLEAMLTDCDRRETYWKCRHGGERELLMLAPPSKTPGIVKVIRERFPDAGLTIQPQVQGRAFRIECDVFEEGYGNRFPDAEETLFALAGELMPLGAYFDRPYGRLPELVYKEPTSLDIIRRLKNIFDPDHILNPGKLCF